MRKAIAGFILTAAAFATIFIAPATARSQETPPADPQTADEAATPCRGLDAARMGAVLRGVPRYGATYVLIVPERLAETIPDAKAPGVKDLHVGVQGGSAAGDAARAIGITNITSYDDSTGSPHRLLQDVSSGTIDAAVLWAPLAGLGIVDLGLDGAVSAYSLRRPRIPAPLRLQRSWT
jgi:hypothetical protein